MYIYITFASLKTEKKSMAVLSTVCVIYSKLKVSKVEENCPMCAVQQSKLSHPSDIVEKILKSQALLFGV